MPRKGQKIQPGMLKGGKSQPATKAKLGTGKRFAALETKLSHEPGVTNPGGLAAAIGRSKYGKKKMTNLAVSGKKRKK